MVGNKDIKPATSIAPFASPDHFDKELKAFLDEASSRLCQWIADAAQTGPLPSLSSLPDVAPASHGLSTSELLKELQK